MKIPTHWRLELGKSQMCHIRNHILSFNLLDLLDNLIYQLFPDYNYKYYYQNQPLPLKTDCDDLQNTETTCLTENSTKSALALEKSLSFDLRECKVLRFSVAYLFGPGTECLLHLLLSHKKELLR